MKCLNAILIYKKIDEYEFNNIDIKLQVWINQENDEVEYRIDVWSLDQNQMEWLADYTGLSINKISGYNYIIFYE